MFILFLGVLLVVLNVFSSSSFLSLIFSNLLNNPSFLSSSLNPLLNILPNGEYSNIACLEHLVLNLNLHQLNIHICLNY